MLYGMSTSNQILELFEHIKYIFCGKIQVVKVELSLTSLDGCNIITNNTSHFCTSLISAWIFSNMTTNKQEKSINLDHTKELNINFGNKEKWIIFNHFCK
jgi:hypothetical protein